MVFVDCHVEVPQRTNSVELELRPVSHGTCFVIFAGVLILGAPLESEAVPVESSITIECFIIVWIVPVDLAESAAMLITDACNSSTEILTLIFAVV